MKSKKKVQRITVSLQEIEYEALLSLAERSDVSLSWLTRQAIADFLEKHKNKQLQIPLHLIRQ